MFVLRVAKQWQVTLQSNSRMRTARKRNWNSEITQFHFRWTIEMHK